MRLRRLSMKLSSLDQLKEKVLTLEQYSTEGNLASLWINDILRFGDLFSDCTVCDLGSGNGVLGLGCLLMGASSATFVEIDRNACNTIKSNASNLGFSKAINILNMDVRDLDINNKFDLIICNPPWGYQNHKADRIFLEKILNLNTPTHLLHSSKSKHLEKLFIESQWSVQRYREAPFSIPAVYEHHKSPKSVTSAGIWRLMPPILSNAPDR